MQFCRHHFDSLLAGNSPGLVICNEPNPAPTENVGDKSSKMHG